MYLDLEAILKAGWDFPAIFKIKYLYLFKFQYLSILWKSMLGISILSHWIEKDKPGLQEVAYMGN